MTAATIKPDDKTVASMAAAFALRGHALNTTTRADDGSTTFTVSRWNQSRVFSHWSDVRAFFIQIGGTV